MIPVWQIPRNSMVWLLLSFVIAVLPHLERLPVWTNLAMAIVIIWRIQIYRGHWPVPVRSVKLLLVGMSVAGLVVGYGRLIGLEPMVALLIIGFTLKLLEMNQKRDALAVIYLGWFVVAAGLLFEQTIPAALYTSLAVILITTGLIGLHQSQGYKHPFRGLQLTLKLFGQSLPLMLMFFILMPRLAPLWSVPMQSHAAKTGVGETMAPGDISKLGRSGELAFRVTFQGEVPEASRLYWRGLVLSRFDGRRWTQAGLRDYYRDGPLVQWHGEDERKWQRLIERLAEPVNYEVILEPTHQQWLYALATPESGDEFVGLTRDFGLTYQFPVQKRLRYGVKSWLDYRTEADSFADWRYQNETNLPAGFNPRSVDRARQWRAESVNEQVFIDRVLGWFNREFTYTLDPPLLGRHTADEFLFGYQRGFCEHFASSFVVLMRAAGVPARVVVGYQGGEINPYENYLLVHQYDAHAWAEVWLKGRGWVRVDPTAAVAPQRIERGFDQFFETDEKFLADSPLSLLRFRHVALVNWVRMRLDMLDYAWARWVLGYDTKIQIDLITRLLGAFEPLRIGIAFLLVCAITLGLTGLTMVLNNRRNTDSRPVKAYRKFCLRLAKTGLLREPGESPGVFARRVSQLRPDLANSVQQVTREFEAVAYANQPDDGVLIARVKVFRV